MDFALVLFVFLVITGSICLWDRFVRVPRRAAATAGTPAGGEDVQQPVAAAREPLLVEYSRAFFPVILIVFLLRSFVVEPFRIPSGSMLPNLYVGDFILVNKFVFGIRLPILNSKVLDVSGPRRGDVMVFRFPHDPSTNFIKRVVGLPGDRLLYDNKKLYINGEAVAQEDAGEYTFQESGRRRITGLRRMETLDEHVHAIVLDESRQPNRLEFSVPEGSYFVMGDNRDHSNDSRYWGFVPEQDIIGKAFFIWFSWDSANGGGVNWSRIGNLIE